MLVSEVLNIVSASKPNSMTQSDLIRHLDDLESYLAKTVYEVSNYTPITSTDQALQVPVEFDRIYSEYLNAKIDYEDGRQDLYQLSYGQYMNTYMDLRGYVNRSSTKSKVKFNNYM